MDATTAMRRPRAVRVETRVDTRVDTTPQRAAAARPQKATPIHPKNPAPAAASSAIDAVWDTLAEDTGLQVWVFAVTGQLERASDAGAAAYNLTQDDIPQTSVQSMMPAAKAAERLRVFEEAVRTGLPQRYDSMTAGVCHRVTVRPVPGDSTRVLVTAAPFTARSSAAAIALGDAGPLTALTPREREVLGLIGRGLSTAGIAKALSRSVKTVEGHRVSLGNKLGVRNRVELARIAIRAGLCEFDPHHHDQPLPHDESN